MGTKRNALEVPGDDAWDAIRRRRLGKSGQSPADIAEANEITPARALSHAADYIQRLGDAIERGNERETRRLLNFRTLIERYIETGRERCDND